MEKNELAGGINSSFVAKKWRRSNVSDRLCSAFRYRFFLMMDAKIKVALGRRFVLENRGCYIDGPWPVHCLSPRKGYPFCATIVRDTSPDVGLVGLIKATDDAIQADKSMKRLAGINEPELDIKDIKNNCSFRKGRANKYVRTRLSLANFWR